MARVCLCVNQIAHIRNMNKAKTPDPVSAAVAAEIAGIDGITVQLREDRMDIIDRDVAVLKEVVQSHLNIAVAMNDDMIKKVVTWLPDMVTLLPAANEMSMDQSLDVVTNLEYLEEVVTQLRANNIVVSALIKPDPQQIRAAARVRLDYVQINTAPLATIGDLGTMGDMVEQIRSVAIAANKLGLGVAAGRGLNEQALKELSDIPLIEEFNIGRSIIAKSLLVGMERAVKQFKFMLA
ncbi:MAG TPA: pyridoxine 5'-phosphate synthase [bacterium]|nr:pyridoxine 5'-phosphate synthase [bacterium]HPN44211.1 pyridoxine 5'-phosphate synthase [bacterium]